MFPCALWTLVLFFAYTFFVHSLHLQHSICSQCGGKTPAHEVSLDRNHSEFVVVDDGRQFQPGCERSVRQNLELKLRKSQWTDKDQSTILILKVLQLLKEITLYYVHLNRHKLIKKVNQIGYTLRQSSEENRLVICDLVVCVDERFLEAVLMLAVY